MMYYIIMHRTQLMLESWQYEALRLRAERSALSISEVVRQILTQHLSTKERPAGIYRIEGIGSNGGSSARDHDAFLYGKKRRR